MRTLAAALALTASLALATPALAGGGWERFRDAKRAAAYSQKTLRDPGITVRCVATSDRQIDCVRIGELSRFSIRIRKRDGKIHLDSATPGVRWSQTLRVNAEARKQGF